MNKTVSRVQLLLQWVAIAAMFALPTFWRYELSSLATWVCTRGAVPTQPGWSNVCYAEPTLYHRLGFSETWDEFRPRIESIPVIPLDDLDVASASTSTIGQPSGEHGAMVIRASNSCWTHHPQGHSWCWGRGFGYFEVMTAESDFVTSAHDGSLDAANDFNSFLRHPRERTFRLHRPRPHNAWHLGVYAVAVLLALFTMRRMKHARARALQAAFDAVARTYERRATTSPYRD